VLQEDGRLLPQRVVIAALRKAADHRHQARQGERLQRHRVACRHRVGQPQRCRHNLQARQRACTSAAGDRADRRAQCRRPDRSA